MVKNSVIIKSKFVTQSVKEIVDYHQAESVDELSRSG
jgi:hypothetical protein